jgi:hypothetical protein
MIKKKSRAVRPSPEEMVFLYLWGSFWGQLGPRFAHRMAVGLAVACRLQLNTSVSKDPQVTSIQVSQTQESGSFSSQADNLLHKDSLPVSFFCSFQKGRLGKENTNCTLGSSSQSHYCREQGLSFMVLSAYDSQ